MTPRLPVVFLTLALSSTTAWSWHSQGHVLATTACLEHLQGLIPEFMVERSAVIAHCSVDPDAFKFRTDSPVLYRTERPEHFMDMEYLEGAPLPESRERFIAWCHEAGVPYSRVGTLPYALTEWTYRLAVAFAEHRRWPDNEAIRMKCLVYAGHLAHYATDACMPLHATIHFDGRVNEDRESPRSGIHRKVDALMEHLEPHQLYRPGPTEFQSYADVLAAVWSQIKLSNGLVDSVYALETQLPEQGSPLPRKGPVTELIQLCQKRSTLFLGSLYVTAWEKSNQVQIPDWLER